MFQYELYRLRSAQLIEEAERERTARAATRARRAARSRTPAEEKGPEESHTSGTGGGFTWAA